MAVRGPVVGTSQLTSATSVDPPASLMADGWNSDARVRDGASGGLLIRSHKGLQNTRVLGEIGRGIAARSQPDCGDRSLAYRLLPPATRMPQGVEGATGHPQPLPLERRVFRVIDIDRSFGQVTVGSPIRSHRTEKFLTAPTAGGSSPRRGRQARAQTSGADREPGRCGRSRRTDTL